MKFDPDGKDSKERERLSVVGTLREQWKVDRREGGAGVDRQTWGLVMGHKSPI